MSAAQTPRYPYATGDLLEVRNSYSYTPYHGASFLEAWRLQRDAAMATDAASRPADTPAESPTGALLRDTLAGLASATPDDAINTLNRLLQRFEVTKRVHGEYNANWRPVDPQDYHDLNLYLQLARCLDQAYALTSGLQYLNGLLKCLDTLTAYQATLPPGQRETLRELVHAERRHVDALQRKLQEAST